MPDSNIESPDTDDADAESADTEPADAEPVAEEEQTRSGTKAADEQYCSSCGETIKKEAEVCPECGVRQQGSSGGEEKNPGIAALLSFIVTGAGQIYNGEIGKGIGLIVLQVINVVLMAVAIGFITFPVTWGYGIYDAHSTAKKINSGEKVV